MIWKPLGDRLLVRRIEERAKGAIIIPEAAKETPCRAEIVARGAEVKHPELTPGANVLIPKYSGTEINVDGAALLFVKEEDVIALVK